MIALFLNGRNLDAVTAALGAGHRQWLARRPEDSPSLVVFLASMPQIDAVVLQPGFWSPQHMALAAKVLKSRNGRLVMLGKRPQGMEKDIPLLPRTEDPRQVPQLLTPPEAPRAESAPSPEYSEAEKNAAPAAPVAPEPAAAWKPVLPGNGETLFLAIFASEDGLGAMEQCPVLLRFLEQLGIAAALLLTKEQLTRLENAGLPLRTAGHTAHLGTVPVVTDCRAALYDAYIRFQGVLTQKNRNALWDCDWNILVCGGEEAQLSATARALAILSKRKYASILISPAPTAPPSSFTGMLSRPWAMAVAPAAPWEQVEDAATAPYRKLLLPFLQEKYALQDYAWEHRKEETP